MGKSFRNVVAGNAMGRHKAKRIINDRGNRRANDTRNTKGFMSELDDMDDDLPEDGGQASFYEACAAMPGYGKTY